MGGLGWHLARVPAILIVMHRRYAILDDNQRVLEECIDRLRAELPALVDERTCAAMVIGSVAEGRARDGSDIDVVLVLRKDSPRRADYRWWDADVAPRLARLPKGRFPLQPVIIGRQSLRTTEPHLRQALATGLPVWDPGRLFDDQHQAAS